MFIRAKIFFSIFCSYFFWLKVLKIFVNLPFIREYLQVVRSTREIPRKFFQHKSVS